jgi:ribulose-bisphosphate carboxylase large chain
MNDAVSSCEIGPAPARPSTGSRVIRFQPGFQWQDVPVAEYKESGDHWRGVSRTALVGETGEKTAFHVRYFEVAPGGFSSLEEHAHEHVVVVLRGRGQVKLGAEGHEIGFGDTVYVAPKEVHQFRNLSADEPFGFLCVVDAARDRPVLRANGQ